MFKHLPNEMMKCLTVSTLALAVSSVTQMAIAADQTLTIVTSFPQYLTKVFKAEFEKSHPNVKLEVLKKNTSAGIKYINDTATNNKTDLSWASAPDAFEVLKGSDLLQKYDLKAIEFLEQP